MQAGGRGRVIAGQPLHDAKVVKGRGLACQVAEMAEQRQRLLVACGGSWVVAGELLHGAQLVEGASLAQLFTEVAEPRQRLLQAGGGGRVVPGQPFQDAQLLKGAGLAGPVAGCRAMSRAAWLRAAAWSQ